jgi:hypothetical protein
VAEKIRPQPAQTRGPKLFAYAHGTD